ncbi:glycoside hydrolase family 30 protein [Cellulomonas soli]|uniref:Glycosyl hydrolase n=1 Tax=Cellulomonas soli TaxID=931535 RepID=A0A512PFL3_9CELL|nr:glycoside hydrolase family 30 beta sandwich domain-containing protein [Cellulomonas soli]NYI59870.1 glucosylceramidase [Cellulomonas soli]GEP69987.1 glycosyl hydrolase [Cellulomonas soli]
MTPRPHEHDSAAPAQVTWVVTTEAAPWQTRENLGFGPVTAMPDVFVQTDRPGQAVEGFGASFNELGWTSLSLLTDDERAQILDELFTPGVGANLSLCRMPVGANDFSLDWYSYDEVDGDLALEHFSIEHDLQTLVPFIRAAQERQPSLRLWASPWSPPSWMKTNGHYAGALPMPGIQDVENGLRPDQVGHEGTDMFRLEEPYLQAYAAYFGRFVDAYRELGIPIGMVMPQNEFNSPQVFPSCTWTPQGLARFVRHLGPQMQRRGVEVFLGTLERGDDALVQGVLDDPEAAAAIQGVGIQWAGKSALPFVHRDHPELRVYQTEQECGDGLNDWRYCRYSWGLMRHYFSHGAGAYMYWNVSLLRGGLSRWGWAQNSFVTVDAQTRTYAWNHEYHLLKHVSHFVQVGARFVPTLSYTGFENQLVFRNPDESLVVVVHNPEPHEQAVRVLVGGQLLTPTLPADSFSTFVVPAELVGG